MDIGSDLVAVMVAIGMVTLFRQFAPSLDSHELPPPPPEEPSIVAGTEAEPTDDRPEPPPEAIPDPIPDPLPLIPTPDAPPESPAPLSPPVDELTIHLRVLQTQLQTLTPHEVSLMADNALDKLDTALTDLSKILDDSAVKTALGAIPASIKTPIVEGLQKVLDVLKKTLKELQDKIASVVNLDKLFTTTTGLLDAAEGLVTDQKSTLEDVKKVISTVQDVGKAKDKITGILAKIDEIVNKLKAA